MKAQEEILEFVLNAGSDSPEVFGGRFKGGYELQQCPEEISEFLFRYQEMEVDNFLEIGVAGGGNTRIFTDFLNINNVYTMDLDEHPSIDYPGNPKARENNFKNLKNKGKLIHFWGDTHSISARSWLEDLYQVNFQMVFIDGDHTYDGIQQDLDLILPYLDDGALVIFHDTVIDVGSLQFDQKLKNNLYPQLKLIDNFVSETIFKKGISVYKYD